MDPFTGGLEGDVMSGIGSSLNLSIAALRRPVKVEKARVSYQQSKTTTARAKLIP